VSRPLRFEGKTMEAARHRAQESLGTDVSGLTVLRHGRELSGGLFGFFQRERFVIELAEPDPAPQPPSRRESAREPVREVQSPPDACPEALDKLAPSPKTSGEDSLSERLAALAESTNDTVGVSFDRELRGVLADAEAVVSDAAGQGAFIVESGEYPPPLSETPPATVSFGATEAFGGLFRDRLFAAGLAEEYLPDPLFSHPALALPLRLGTIAPAGAVLGCPGDLLLLVGDADESLAIAEQLEAKIDEDDIVIVVSHRRLSRASKRARAHSPLEAGAMVLERRLAGLLTIVVLDSGCRNGFVPRTVIALRPEAIWAVLEASTDEKSARRLEGLVGHLDALVLYGMLTSPRPAGLIGRGWPLAYIDGWEASPLAVAARLVSLVEAETVPADRELASGEQVPAPPEMQVGVSSQGAQGRRRAM
jgi:hypothetical protein